MYSYRIVMAIIGIAFLSVSIFYDFKPGLPKRDTPNWISLVSVLVFGIIIFYLITASL